MSTLRGRDKRAQRVAVVAAKHSALEPDMRGDEDDDDTPYDFAGLTNQDDPGAAEDMTYNEARRMYG
jgi:hypothetical protein